MVSLWQSIKFSLAASPYSTREHILDKIIVEKILKYRELIHDINFTVRIPPFDTDAHAVQISEMQAAEHLHFMLEIQRICGVQISALCNNIYVDPTKDNLSIFVNNFSKFYAAGVRSVTLPHAIWVRDGVLQKEFPELVIKNTVLRQTRSAQDFVNFAQSGFHYVNLDRRLWRDLNTLKEIKKAQIWYKNETGKSVNTSLLIGEGCQGDCPFWEEHYQVNTSIATKQNFLKLKKEGNPDARNIINDFVKKISGCKVNLSVLSTVGPSPFIEDLHDLFENIDIIKLAGRHFPNVLELHLNFIEEFSNTNPSDTIVMPIAETYKPLNFTSIHPDFLLTWRRMIKKCKHQCWNCECCQKTQFELMNLLNNNSLKSDIF